MEDHYFGMLDNRVLAFMQELDEELWKLGILAKTEHKEVAPRQFELAPIFSTTNIATDYNQLTMELMKKIADKHGFACLLHEKPFEGINGSGKHNNWSISTNTGVNLLEPGETPATNAQFLLFLCAVIKGADEYQDLLRVSVATPSNDHRLGANEAPPAIISVHLGDELTSILECIEENTVYDKIYDKKMEIGVDILPAFPKDTTDRNRTSPFAFTGNKFEFRMLGSSLSIACPNIMLNTIVAEELSLFADELEKAEELKPALAALIKKTIREHKRILFSGNGYTDEWVKEAEKRGLLNLKTTIDALPYYTSEKNIKLFTKHKIFTENEMRSRGEILLENYCKTINIEALTMVDMVQKQILPAVEKVTKSLTETILNKKAVSPAFDCAAEMDHLHQVDEHYKALYFDCQKLEKACIKTTALDSMHEQGKLFSTAILKMMETLRADADALESLCSDKAWPIPCYTALLFHD